MAQYPPVPSSVSAGYQSSVGASAGGMGTTYTSNTANQSQHSVRIANELTLTGEGADIKINNKSMKEWMESVDRRLLILEPRPELLAKHEALRNAYEHYKTLEAILYDNKE